MSYKIEYNKVKNYIHIIVKDEFGSDQYDEIMKNVVKDQYISTHAHTIWDLRQMDFTNVRADFMKEVIEHRKKYDQLRGKNAKAAIVADSDLGFGVSRQYEALSYEFSQKMQTFRTLEAAIEWLQAI